MINEAGGVYIPCMRPRETEARDVFFSQDCDDSCWQWVLALGTARTVVSVHLTIRAILASCARRSCCCMCRFLSEQVAVFACRHVQVSAWYRYGAYGCIISWHVRRDVTSTYSFITAVRQLLGWLQNEVCCKSNGNFCKPCGTTVTSLTIHLTG